ncbi:type VI secretion system tube protein TssD [Sinomicrobium sp. M5D2P9]
MSFLAKFEIDEMSYNVLEYDIRVEKGTDHSGKPSTNAKGGEIRLVLETDMKDSFSDWVISNSQTKDGKLIFYKRDGMSRMRTTSFKKGYCIRYHEKFRAIGDEPMTTEIVISAKEINIGNTAYTKKWPMQA